MGQHDNDAATEQAFNVVMSQLTPNPQKRVVVTEEGSF
jgi:hypothetical protein